MPDISNRDELERKLARLMGKLLNAYGGRLLEALGDPPSLDNIPAEFWDEEGRIMMQALRPFLEKIFLDQAEELMGEAPSGVDWSQANEAAIDWARTYSFELVTGINATSRQALQHAISGYFQEPTTRGELERQIMNTIASPVRAEMIAVTEVTRAASEGEQQIAKELREQGINMKPVWQTNNDELVCEICGPRHDKEITDGMFPPAHPRCRCWVNHELRRASD